MSLGIETAQVLSVIGWLVPDSHIQRRRQCQSLPLTHRGQTNALISSWHTATTFLPLALPASLPPFIFSAPPQLYFQSLPLPLSFTFGDTIHLPPPLVCCCKAGHWCRIKLWALNWLWLLACWSFRVCVRGIKSNKPQPGVNMLHISCTSLLSHQRAKKESQAPCCALSVWAGGWRLSCFRWMSVGTNTLVSFTEMGWNVSVCTRVSLLHRARRQKVGDNVYACARLSVSRISPNTSSILFLIVHNDIFKVWTMHLWSVDIRWSTFKMLAWKAAGDVISFKECCAFHFMCESR